MRGMKDASKNQLLQEKEAKRNLLLKEKVVAFYKNGAPVSVIQRLTGLSREDVDVYLADVELTPEELRMRDELNMTYLANTTSRVRARRETLSQENESMLNSVSGKINKAVEGGVGSLLFYVQNASVYDGKEAEKMVNVLGKLLDIRQKLHDGLEKADKDVIREVVDNIQIEQTDTTRQLILEEDEDEDEEEGLVLLDRAGKRKKRVEENSVQRKVSVNVRPL